MSGYMEMDDQEARDVPGEDGGDRINESDRSPAQGDSAGVDQSEGGASAGGGSGN